MTDASDYWTIDEYQHMFNQLAQRPEIVMDEPIDHPLRTAVMEAIGAGSTCWELGDDTGNAVFDTARAAEIGNGLLAAIMERDTEVVTAAAQAVARCNAYLDLLDRADGLLADGWGHDDPTDPHPVLGRWYADYRAALAYPPLADIGQLTLEVETGS